MQTYPRLKQSYITYAGTSSMEVRIDVCNDEGKMFCSAYYLMVARDNKTGGSYAVPKLAFDFEDDKATAALRFQLAKMRQENRIAASKVPGDSHRTRWRSCRPSTMRWRYSISSLSITPS